MSNTTKKLIQIQADAHALWVRFHGYHWNIKGLQFYAIHEMTENAYEAMAKLFDDAAERALQLGGRALTCAKDLLENTKVPKCEKKDAFGAAEVLEGLKRDYGYLLGEFKALDTLAQKDGDTTTSSFAQDKIAEFEKAIWMLENALDMSCCRKK